MVESSNSPQQRAFFPPGKQRDFLLDSKMVLGISWEELAKICGTGTRNLCDWRNEKNSMSLVAVENICTMRMCPIPDDISVRDAYWYVNKGARAGGKAVYEKHHVIGGDRDVRKAKWREWWEREGRFSKNLITNPASFKKPRPSKELAEFVGIVLGDGGISDYQITITLHRFDDAEYSQFVRKLIQKLFGVRAGTFRNKTSLADSIVISRIGIVDYLVNDFGLKRGNKVKQQVDIPGWIKQKESFRIACVRGLVDTDGSVYTHSYNSKGKRYNYKKLQYTSLSRPLLDSVCEIMREIGLNSRIRRGSDVKLENTKDVRKYFQIVGTHNKKHSDRYKK